MIDFDGFWCHIEARIHEIFRHELKISLIKTIFAIDVSTSMNAQDIKPSRIDRVKFEISKIIDNLKGENSHHQAETIFKAFGRALRIAVEHDEKIKGETPSTKGSL